MLYKHNDELFNIYYGIFLWTLNFCLFWPIMQIRKKGVKVKKYLLLWANLYPKWSPLLKIKISSNGQNCSILSQKVPKFELYKHNDELFNLYSPFFMNFELLPILTDCYKKGGIFSSETTEPISTKLCWNNPWVVPFQIVSVSAVLYPKWSPLLKIKISSNGQNCSILSQKVRKFELYKHNDELFNIYYGIFLWTLNFCLFWPIMQIRKKGGWN